MRGSVLGVLGLLGALGLGSVVSGCTSDPNSVAEQARSGSQKGYVSGDGTVEKIASGARGAPVTLSGALLDGTNWSVEGAKGKVVVVNVWASWCPPCVAETPDLEKVWTAVQKAGKPVLFRGILFRDNKASGAAFIAKHGVTYPSLLDEGGVLILGLQGKASSVPTTLVLDTSGRIAARASGAVSEGVLAGLIDDTLADP